VSIAKHHLAWFRLKCRYPIDSKEYSAAYAKLHGATYSDIEKLHAEFEEYDDGSIQVKHYQLYGEWFASIGEPETAKNMKGIYVHRQKYRVSKRIDGKLHVWTYYSLSDAIKKRDAIFA
jgi:hypothetical protein